MHSSSWLCYSWDFADIVNSATVHSQGASDTCSMHTGRVSRRERFRLDAGPSREQLLWLQILSILCKIKPPSSVLSARRINEQQLEKNTFGFPVLDACATAGSGRGPDTRVALQSTSLRAVSSVEKLFSNAGNGVLPCVPCLEKSLLSPSSTVCGKLQHEPWLSLDGSEQSELKLKELLQSVSWPFSAVGDVGSMDAFCFPWENVPESADPIRGSGYKGVFPALNVGKRQIHKNHEDKDDQSGNYSLGRGERKRLQVENIASALRSFQLKAGSRIVDFGCGSGALTLPLAAVFPELSFVGVDFKQQSITLLEDRARRADLRNVTAFHGCIENFFEPFDACVALHACGIATDLALLQALKHRAAYVMSPCCIGKLQIRIQEVMLNSAKRMQSEELCSVCPSAAIDKSFSNVESLGKNLTAPSRSLDSNKIVLEIYHNGNENGLALDHPCGPPLRDSRESISLRLVYPRSRWLRSSISEIDFQVLARAADWSSYDHESTSSRLHSLCKIVVELDRNEASRELGYWTGLFSLSNEKAGTVGVSHVLVGKFQQL